MQISEFLTNNQLPPPQGLVDEDGEHSDWIELENTGPTAVSLNGWYLTDNAGDLRRWQFPVSTPAVTLGPGERMLVRASGKNRKALANRLHTDFRLESSGGFIAVVRPDGLTIEHSISYPQQVQDISYGLPTAPWDLVVPAPTAAKAKVPLSAAEMAAGWNSDAQYDDSGWQSGQTGFGYDTGGTYGALLGAGGDLQASMFNVNPTALVRMVFNVADAAQISALRLQMKYDDGFVCYLNGAVIAQSNAPASLAWDSSAVADRAGGLTQTNELFNSPTAHEALVSGANVLAIQLLNFTNGSTQDTDDQGTPNGSRTLALPQLEGTFVQAPTYLLTLTPNNVNTAARTNLGPLLSLTTNRPPRPFGNSTSPPVVVVSKVLASLRPVATVELKYRVMFAAESTANTAIMVDDGTNGDEIAGDGFFTGQIPTTTLAAGQMLRWRVVATDTTGVSSTDPPYRDTADNDQYFGTVAEEIQTAQSLLPVLHWFVANPGGSQSEGGARCSLFYLGRFYDNVFVNLHGQSSAGFPVAKKSHDFNFSQDNRFTWKEGEEAQRAMNLITTWADKSRIRDTLAWESWEAARHIAAHWAQLVRVQQNGAFWGIYDMVENGDEDFLDRAGLDQNGALYKIYNSLDNTGGVEKKTREFEGAADLQALITAMGGNSLTARRQYAYDNIDIPALVNYLANNVLILNNDFGHKNYYIYRDTNGTGEWSLLPWDQDLSLGHTWTSSQNYFNDDIHSQAGLVLGASTGNRVMNLIMNNSSATIAPEMAQMFLRRLRTLMDTRLMPPNTTNSPLDQRTVELLDSIDPPGAAFLTDADLDLQKWGFWLDGNGSATAAPGQDAATHDHGARRHVMRLLNSNPNPPYPAAQSNAEGLSDTRPPFFPGRRTRLYLGNLTLAGNPIPAAQTATPAGLSIEQIDFNPTSGNAEQEFFVIKNAGSAAVDLSGWKISGAVDYTFRGGTVVPAGGGATQNVGLLHVVRNPKAFRQRTTGPKGNEFRLVVGGYNGRLSARGGSIELRDLTDTVIASAAFAEAPTAAQNALRVTEINFAPGAPTPQEAAALAGVKASDFEFIELINTGTAPLDLGSAQFDRGITFVFPTGFTLAPGARTVVVSQAAAFPVRYGSAANIAGQFEGNLDNSGEEVRLLDAVGEEVLRFTYDRTWFPPVDGGGYSLVTRSSNPAYDGYNAPTTWAISGQPAGSPGGEDSGFSQAFDGWRHDFFSAAEISNPLLSGPAADADTDGWNNLGEYAFAKQPRQSADPSAAALGTVTVEGVEHRALSFNRPARALDLTYAIEVSTDGTAWSPIASLPTAPVDLGGGVERVTFAITGPTQPRTTYLIRPTALHSTGASFGEQLSFTTPNSLPVANPKTLHAPPAGVATVVYTIDDTSDADGDARTLAVLAYSGTGAASIEGNQILFTSGGFSGAETIEVQASDGYGGTAAATITLRNEAPVANADRFPLETGSSVLNVLVNDTDPDGDLLAITSVSASAGSSATTDGSTITYTPGATPAALEEVTYTLSDLRGGTALGRVTLVNRLSVTRVLANSNGAVSGVSGARWSSFGSPSIFAQGGQAGWLGAARIGASSFRGVFSGDLGSPLLRVRSNDPAPDANGVLLPLRFQSFRQPVFAPESFAFIGKLAGPRLSAGEDSGIWAGGPDGWQAIAREGADAPGTGGAKFHSFSSVAMPATGVVFFTAKLKAQPGLVTADSDIGLWVGNSLALREGQIVDLGRGPVQVKSFEAIANVKGSPGHGRYDSEAPSLDALIAFTDGSTALAMVGADATISPIALSGQSDDEGRIPTNFGTPSSPGGGGLPSAVTTFQIGAAGFTNENNMAIYDFAEERIIAQKGTAAAGIDLAVFETFQNPVAGRGAGGTRMTAFLANVSGPASANSGVWADSAGATPLLRLVAREGIEPPGAPGTRFKTFRSLSIVDGRGPAFTAKLSSGARRVSSADDHGLWATDSTGGLHLVVREGDQVSGKRLRTFRVLEAVSGSAGQQRSWTHNDPAATLIYLGHFTDGSSAVVTATIP